MSSAASHMSRMGPQSVSCGTVLNEKRTAAAYGAAGATKSRTGGTSRSI
jgi:hypothetical protein